MSIVEQGLFPLASSIAGIALVLFGLKLPRPCRILLLLLALAGMCQVNSSQPGHGLPLTAAMMFGDAGGWIAIAIVGIVGAPLRFLGGYSLLAPLLLCIKIGMSCKLLSYLPAEGPPRRLAMTVPAQEVAWKWREGRAALVETGLAVVVVVALGSIVALDYYLARTLLLLALAAGVVVVRLKWPDRPMAFGLWVVAVLTLPRALLTASTVFGYVGLEVHLSLQMAAAIGSALMLVVGPQPPWIPGRWMNVVYLIFAVETGLNGMALILVS